jgi:UDP-glucose 4-epimerase
MPGSILITGGFGNLGSWLTEYFCNAGFEVTVLAHSKKRALPNLTYKSILADITNLASLQKTLTQTYDYCLHTASHNDFFVEDYPQKALDVNTLGTRNLLEVLHNRINKHFIYFSTFHVYGKNAGTITEETLPEPKNDYANTHLFAEFYVKQFVTTKNFPASIIRLTNSYGAPKQIDATKWYLVLNDVTRSAYEKKEITLLSNGKPTRDFIAMFDVCQILHKLLTLPASGEIYNISGENCITMLEIAQKVQHCMPNKTPITLNQQDKSSSSELFVSSQKLYSKINFTPKERFEIEIHNIITLLENHG